MEYLLEVLCAIIFIMIVLSASILIRWQYCKNCPLKKECENKMKKDGGTICENNDHTYSDMCHHNILIQ